MHDLYLPIVKPEITASLYKEVKESEEFSSRYINNHLKRLDKENPTVAAWIRKHAKTSKDKMSCAYCALIVYRLLESQAEANRMNVDI